MRYSFVQQRLFSSLVQSHQLTINDLRALENAIMEDPTGWPVISGTGGVRKMRFAPERSGGDKSGGLRVLYLLLEAHKHVHLITLYAESEASNITPAQRHVIAGLVREIKRFYSQGN